MLADLSIEPRMKLSAMSKGTLDKVQLALVMSRAAKLYLLDEPIGGVDPAAREYILSTIIQNYSEEASILPVSYTHLDVYKRQPLACAASCALAAFFTKIQPFSRLLMFLIANLRSKNIG